MTLAAKGVLLTVLLAACSTPTQVVVGFDGEAGVMERATTFRVRLYRSGETSAFYDETRATSEFMFPARVPVSPLGDDASRRFRILGELSDGAGVFATVRAETGFVPGALRYVWLRFDDACIDTECDAQTSCRDGACVGACVTLGAEDVMPTPSQSCGSADGGVDASLQDGGVDAASDVGLDADEEDVGPIPDGGPDTGPDCTCDCNDMCVEGECVPVEPATSVDLGTSHACAIATSGLYCWGSNRSGELGTGDIIAQRSPMRVIETTDAVQVSLGNSYSILRYTDGTAFAWGSNEYKKLGIDEDSPDAVLVPTRIGTPLLFQTVDAGLHHACGISDRQPYCWGRNQLRQVAPTETRGTYEVPRSVASGGGWDSVSGTVSAGMNHSCAIRMSQLGRVYCWGSQQAGKLGNNMSADFATSIQAASGATRYESISAGGRHTCGVTVEHEVWCFGSDDAGQKGNGDSTQTRAQPVVIDGPMTWSSVSAGTDHTCAIRDEVLYCWGSNLSGQLGLPAVASMALVPMPLPGEWSAVVAGSGSTCAINTSGMLHCWGLNTDGQLGLGRDDEEVAAPTRVCVEP